MGRPIRALCLSLVLAMGAAKAVAATGEMTLEINDSERVGLYGSAVSVIVGNPQVADVAMLDSHSLVISGKGFGATRVQVFDGAGRELFNRRVTIVAPQYNQVTLYRGADSRELNCSPKCHAIAVNPMTGEPATQPGVNTVAMPQAPAQVPAGTTTTTTFVSRTTEAH